MPDAIRVPKGLKPWATPHPNAVDLSGRSADQYRDREGAASSRRVVHHVGRSLTVAVLINAA